MAVSVRDLDNDATLVVAAQNGDPDAFAELFRRHYEGVRRSCARRLADLPQAEEVAQAAFVRAWERIDRCAGERRFGGWVQVIAHNLCIDAIRDRTRTAPTDDAGANAIVAEAAEDAVLRGEAADLVRRALADLPQRQRDVVVARHLEDRRPGEIAAAFGLSVGAVDSLLLRGRRRLAAAVARLESDRGAITTSSASSFAGGVVGGSGRFASLIESVGSTLSRATYQFAATIGMVPGVATPVERFAAAAVVAGAVATGMATLGSTAAVAPPLQVPAVAVAPPALPTAPTVEAPAAPNAPAVPPVVAPAPTPLAIPTPAAPPVGAPVNDVDPSVLTSTVRGAVGTVHNVLEHVEAAVNR